MLAATPAGRRPLISGAAYGAAYYVAVNSLALQLYFGDPTPWQLGWSTVRPSLTGNVVYGASIGLTSRGFVSRQGRGVERLVEL